MTGEYRYESAGRYAFFTGHDKQFHCEEVGVVMIQSRTPSPRFALLYHGTAAQAAVGRMTRSSWRR